MSEHDREAVDTLVTRLQRRATAHDEAEKRVSEAGEDRLLELQAYYDEITGLMDRYEERATGDGDFKAFIEYQEEIAQFMERLPEDLDHRDAFERVDEIMHQRRLTEDDFREARAALEPVENLVGRLDERERSRKQFNAARHQVASRKRDLDDAIEAHERLVELGDADLDAPVERLRDPIEAYNDGVREAFETFKREASAREVLEFVASTDSFPLVDVRQPPQDLQEYVHNYAAGTETIPQLLEYAEYSTSKLEHYVENAGALKRNVSTQQTYLERLDGEPLTVGWPPPEGGTLRARCRELTSVVNRLTDDAGVVERLRSVRDLADRGDYERLRDSAIAQARLDDEERRRLKDGVVQEELATYREQRERLRELLDEYEKR